MASYAAEPSASPTTSTLTQKFLMVGLRQSPELEIVEDGDSIAEIQPPSSTTQSRELSRQSNHQKLLSQGTRSSACSKAERGVKESPQS